MKQLISGISKKTGLIFVTAVLLLGSLGYWAQTGKNSVTTTKMEIRLTSALKVNEKTEYEQGVLK